MPGSPPVVLFTESLFTLTSNNTVSSKSEAKRLIEGGGIKIDDDQINDINLTIDKSYDEKILKIGKKKYFKIIVK